MFKALMKMFQELGFTVNGGVSVELDGLQDLRILRPFIYTCILLYYFSTLQLRWMHEKWHCERYFSFFLQKIGDCQAIIYWT